MVELEHSDVVDAAVDAAAHEHTGEIGADLDLSSQTGASDVADVAASIAAIVGLLTFSAIGMQPIDVAGRPIEVAARLLAAAACAPLHGATQADPADSDRPLLSERRVPAGEL
jgi:hypothetical protein